MRNYCKPCGNIRRKKIIDHQKLLILTCNVQQAQISNKQNMLIEPCANNYLILYKLLKGI